MCFLCWSYLPSCSHFLPAPASWHGSKPAAKQHSGSAAGRSVWCSTALQGQAFARRPYNNTHTNTHIYLIFMYHIVSCPLKRKDFYVQKSSTKPTGIPHFFRDLTCWMFNNVYIHGKIPWILRVIVISRYDGMMIPLGFATEHIFIGIPGAGATSIWKGAKGQPRLITEAGKHVERSTVVHEIEPSITIPSIFQLISLITYWE